MSLFKTKDYSQSKSVKTVYRGGQKPSNSKRQKHQISFKLKKENEAIKGK